jgi:hypothetical protein
LERHKIFILDVMKMCEHRYHVVTQDLQTRTAKKMMTRGASATLENYLAKTNMKLGGLNHSVEVDDPEIMNELQVSLESFPIMTS